MVTKMRKRTEVRRLSQAEHRKKIVARDRRATGLLPEKQLYLIVCEGLKTEPNYFRSFRLPNVEVDIDPAAGDPLCVVKRAVELNVFQKNSGKKKQKKYDAVWVVFDRDSFELDRLNEAFEQARLNNIKVAFSNEAFELWYLLHFEYRDTGMARTEYEAALTENMGEKYVKNAVDMFEKLEIKMQDAIRNAKRLADSCVSNVSLASRNPYTSVFSLVEELMGKL